MKRKNKTQIVFFNASVILAGLGSPKGGSGKLLKWVKQKKIIGLISEIILDEAIRHAKKINLTEKKVKNKILAIFKMVIPPPEKSDVQIFKEIVIDYGDAHLLASCQEEKVDFLVTLDKRHVLILKEKIKKFKIVSPKTLIETLSIHKP